MKHFARLLILSAALSTSPVCSAGKASSSKPKIVTKKQTKAPAKIARPTAAKKPTAQKSKPLSKAEMEYIGNISTALAEFNYVKKNINLSQHDLEIHVSNFEGMKGRFQDLPCPPRFETLHHPIGLGLESASSALALVYQYAIGAPVGSVDNVISTFNDAQQRFDEAIDILSKDHHALLFLFPPKSTKVSDSVLKMWAPIFSVEEIEYLKSYHAFAMNMVIDNPTDPHTVAEAQAAQASLAKHFDEYKKCSVPKQFEETDRLIRLSSEKGFEGLKLAEQGYGARSEELMTQARTALKEAGKLITQANEELERVLIKNKAFPG